MNFIVTLTLQAIKKIYGEEILESAVTLQETRKEFDGQVTIVTFPFTRFSKKSPEQTAAEIGDYLVANSDEVEAYNVIKGFLNISLTDNFWLEQLDRQILRKDVGVLPRNGRKVMVEYSSPNTNKPLHLGHVRNNLLGYAVAELLNAAGYDVIKTNLVNDRGIHICKSMLAWQKFGRGKLPILAD